MTDVSRGARILTINGGSSSIRFAMFDVDIAPRQFLSGRIDRIGSPGTAFHVDGSNAADTQSWLLPEYDYAAAVQQFINWIKVHGRSVSAVGHRIVHGGSKFLDAQRITQSMIEELRRLCPFDPTHLPNEILLIEAIGHQFPNLPQIACFDTAFHQDLPRVARILPIPRRFEAQGIRRYGFHGLSYAFLIEELTRIAGANVADGRVILAHLGNGASLAAVRGGKSIDTSMGFTPTSGVPMATRSGDLDPGLQFYLSNVEGVDAKELNQMLNFQSGLLGVSETSSDMRDLLELETKDLRAAEAVALFCYQVKKWIGAYAAALGGLDTLVFAGGIGEHAPTVRTRICAGLEFLGIELDETRNAARDGLISSNTGRVFVRVIRTDEEQMIARSVCRELGSLEADGRKTVAYQG